MKLQRPELLVSTILAAAVAAMLTFASCVAERFEECPPEVKLYLMTDHETGYYAVRGEGRAHDVEEWYRSIDTVAVYVFDENEKYVTVWHGGRYSVGDEFEVPLEDMNLREGVYTFVAWTNRGEEYMCNLEQLEESGEEFHLDDMRMTMTMIPDGDEVIENDLRHRHHGILERAYVSNNSILSPGPNIIELKPSLHRVNFTVIGVAPSTTGNAHSLTVTDDNRTHDFRNQYIPGNDAYRHRRPFTFTDHGSGGTRGTGDDTRAEQSATMTASIWLMQLDDHSTTAFEIHNADRPWDPPLHTENDLVSLIEMVYGANRRGVDMDEVLEYDISIDLSSKLQTVFYINGWEYIRVNFIP